MATNLREALDEPLMGDERPIPPAHAMGELVRNGRTIGWLIAQDRVASGTIILRTGDPGDHTLSIHLDAGMDTLHLGQYVVVQPVVLVPGS